MKLSVNVKYGLALCVIFGIALFLRIYFSYNNVFADGWVRFHETDPWYHMQQVEILVRHFPHRELFDPYGIYPGGMSIPEAPFFYLILGFITWLIGAGSPSIKLIETVGAYFPAILGALVTVPIYFIGKELFSKKAGLLAAALIAILPGEFLWRSILGTTDYHVAETLLSALTMMFLVLALKDSGRKQISLGSLWRRDWAALRKPLFYSLLSGITLGLYLLTWTGGALFVFVIFVFAIIQFITDHLRNRSTDHLCIIGVSSLLVALVMVIPSRGQYSLWNLQVASLLIGILTFLALGVLSLIMATRITKKVYYPIGVAALGSIGAALFYLVDASLFKSILDRVQVLNPTGGEATIVESIGLSLSSAWEQFTTGFYLALISLALLAYLFLKEGSAHKTLLLVWSLILLVATFGQVRFAYYLVVPIAVLTGYFSWKILEFAGLKETDQEIVQEIDSKERREEKAKEKTKVSKKAKRKKEKMRKRDQGVLITRFFNAKNASGLIALIVIFFLVFYPNIGMSIERVRGTGGVSDDWHESLLWMKDNTPDPFPDPDFYYELHQRPPAGETYSYPESAYGVMSWWDYSNYIVSIAHRMPNATSRGQRGAQDAGLFFTAQDESSASEVLDRLGSKYVIINRDMAVSIFYAMIEWADRDQREYFEWYFQETSPRKLEPVRLYHPGYYQSMCSRLYNFGGKAVVPGNSTWVISYADIEIDKSGVFYDKLEWLGKDAVGFFKDYFNKIYQKTGDNSYKQLTGAANNGKPFVTYEEAQAYLKLRGTSTYRIVGTKEFLSPVPLEKLEHYELIHMSPTTAVTRGNETISAVEIFEYSH